MCPVKSDEKDSVSITTYSGSQGNGNGNRKGNKYNKANDTSIPDSGNNQGKNKKQSQAHDLLGNPLFKDDSTPLMKTIWVNPKQNTTNTNATTGATSGSTGGNTGGNKHTGTGTGGKPDIKCLVCKKSTHGNLVFCERLKDFVPQGNDVKAIPKAP